MLALNNPVSNSPTNFAVELNDYKKIKNDLSEIILKTIQNINSDTMKRLDSCNIKLLEEGIYYPYDFAKALEANERKNPSCQKLRLYMLEKGIFLRGIAPQKHFGYIKEERNLIGFKNKVYVIKINVNASDALASLIAGRTFLGCGQVCMIAYYEAIRIFLGKEKFDLLFSGFSKTPLAVSCDLHETPLIHYVTIQREQPIEKGDMVFFQQVNEYSKKHFGAAGDGYNVICSKESDSQKFCGFMLDNNGVSVQQIKDLLLNEYNKRPVPNDHIFAGQYLETLDREWDQSDSAKTLTKEDFEKGGGGTMHPVFTKLNIEHLKKLKSYSFEFFKKLYS